MSNYIRISTIGSNLSITCDYSNFGDVTAEVIKALDTKLARVLPDSPDLIVLTEHCDVPGYYYSDKNMLFEYIKERDNQVLDFIAGTAKLNGCYIAFPTLHAVGDGTYINSTVLFDRMGKTAGTYNKNHPTISEMTRYNILCGKSAPIIQCDFGRVACAICFDLNFDELRLKYVREKPDLIIFSSMYHGGLMQNYWAYSCRAHFVGAIGNDRPSSIISPVGEIIASSTNYFDFITAAANLDCAVVHLDYNYEPLRAMKDKYRTKVKIFDPGHLGAVLISSETDEFTIGDMIREFGIELLDDYMERSLGYHHNPDEG